MIKKDLPALLISTTLIHLKFNNFIDIMVWLFLIMFLLSKKFIVVLVIFGILQKKVVKELIGMMIVLGIILRCNPIYIFLGLQEMVLLLKEINYGEIDILRIYTKHSKLFMNSVLNKKLKNLSLPCLTEVQYYVHQKIILTGKFKEFLILIWILGCGQIQKMMKNGEISINMIIFSHIG